MKTSATPDFAKLSAPELAEVIGSRSHTLRLNAQRELLRRPKDAVAVAALSALARKADAEGTARIAAIFTLSQWLGAEAVNGLMELAKDAKVREFSIRALGDRPEATKAVPTEFFVQALSDPNDQVKLQAAVARHYFVEGPWDGSSWGTRPDTSGPYYKREKWAHSPCEFPRRRSLSAKKTSTIPA